MERMFLVAGHCRPRSSALAIGLQAWFRSRLMTRPPGVAHGAAGCAGVGRRWAWRQIGRHVGQWSAMGHPALDQLPHLALNGGVCLDGLIAVQPFFNFFCGALHERLAAASFPTFAIGAVVDRAGQI